MVIESGRIVSISAVDEPVPEDSPCIDYGDSVVFPGLIDTHCHLCLPGDGTPAEPYVQGHPREEWVTTGCKNAFQAVDAGITTVRDLGSPDDAGFDVRRRLQEGASVTPRVLVSGAPLTVKGGHLSYFGGQVEDSGACLRRIEDLTLRGVDVIKVIASGSGGPGQSLALPFSVSDLRAIVRHADSAGLSVVAHVTTPDAMAACLDAGVQGLEHAGFWTPSGDVDFRADLMRQIVKQRTFVAPTLQAIYRTWRELPGQSDEDRVRRERTFRDAGNVFRCMLAFDVRFVSGTDAGWLLNPFGDLPLGLELMVEAGMTPAAALSSATTTAASALGMDGQVGCLAPGAYADFIVLPRNPLEGLDVLRQIEDVVVGGERRA